MPENKEMISKELERLGTSPSEELITIPGYNEQKPYRLYIKEVKQIVKPNITLVEE